jgi:tetratricopeptide (TPR) repeat protein
MKSIFIGLFLCCTAFIQAQNNSIQYALKNSDYESAIKLISKEKKTPELDFLKATCYKNIARYDDAISLLEGLVREDLNNIRAINELADSYQLKGNFRKAKIYFFMALQSAPSNRFAQLNYLNSTFKLKEWKQTVQQAHAILQKDSLPALYPVLGDCFVQLSRMDSAGFYYNKAVKSNPDDLNSLSKLCKIYLNIGNYDDLIYSTNRFIQSDSSNQVINQYNGIGYSMNKEYEKAIYRLNKLFLQSDSSFLTNYYLGASYFSTGDYINAYERLTDAFRIDSTNQILYYFLGKSAIYSGYKEKGIQILINGINKMTPKDSVLFNYYINICHGYGSIFNNQDEFNKTKEIKYQKLCYKCNPDYKLALYYIAEIYDTTLKNPEEALNYYQQFLATRPKVSANTPKSPESASYYNAVENRILEIRSEMGKKKKIK